MLTTMWNWMRTEEGQDLTEYALIIALIVIACVAAVTLLGGTIGNVMSIVAEKMANTMQ